MSTVDITQQMTKDVKFVLDHFGDPSKLSQSEWVSSCLVRQAQADEPEMSAVAAIQVVFAAELQTLKHESSTLAALLQGRYWDDQTVAEMLRNAEFVGISNRTFYNEQKKAIERLTELLWTAETKCGATQGASAPVVASALPNSGSASEQSQAADGFSSQITNLSQPKQRSFWIALAALASVIIAALLYVQSLSQAEIPAALPPAAAAVDTSMQVKATTASAERNAAQSAADSPITQAEETDKLCATPARVEAGWADRFLRHQGVSSFTVENTDGGVLSNRVRALAIDANGVWAGYHAVSEQGAAGIGQYEKTAWFLCDLSSQLPNANVNDLAVDAGGNVWITFEEAGVAVVGPDRNAHFTVADGLPSDQTYGLYIDSENNVWVGTWEGVAKYDGLGWSVPYTIHNNTIFNNHVHSILKDSQGDIWIGHLGDGDGVSHFRNRDGKWIHHTTDSSGIGGNRINDVVVKPGALDTPASVWFATDGGVSRYMNEEWKTYSVDDGLPSNQVRAVAIDLFDRVWAATAAGVAYFDDSTWTVYNTLDTLDIAFGLSCQECAFDDDHIWTATAEHGLTHSRIPYAEDALDIVEVCFVAQTIAQSGPQNAPQNDDKTCVSLEEIEQTNSVTVTFPTALQPGDRLRFEVVAAPLSPRQLREDRGDFLANRNADDANLFGAWQLIPVRGAIEPGQRFIFTDYDNPFVAPTLSSDEARATFYSKWRVWMHTRYVGPTINIGFDVES